MKLSEAEGVYFGYGQVYAHSVIADTSTYDKKYSAALERVMGILQGASGMRVIVKSKFIAAFMRGVTNVFYSHEDGKIKKAAS